MTALGACDDTDGNGGSGGSPQGGAAGIGGSSIQITGGAGAGGAAGAAGGGGEAASGSSASGGQAGAGNAGGCDPGQGGAAGQGVGFVVGGAAGATEAGGSGGQAGSAGAPPAGEHQCWVPYYGGMCTSYAVWKCYPRAGCEVCRAPDDPELPDLLGCSPEGVVEVHPREQECCYVNPCYDGRPLWLRGERVHAALARRSGWG